MTTAIGQRNARHYRDEASIHVFAVGQTVRLKTGFGRMPTDIYHITATFPSRGNSPQYRIRNDDERHERMTTEDNLEAVCNPQSATSLIERTFGHGQGAKT